MPYFQIYNFILERPCTFFTIRKRMCQQLHQLPNWGEEAIVNRRLKRIEVNRLAYTRLCQGQICWNFCETNCTCPGLLVLWHASVRSPSDKETSFQPSTTPQRLSTSMYSDPKLIRPFQKSFFLFLERRCSWKGKLLKPRNWHLERG